MKLSFDEIKNITFGAIKLDMREGGVHFFKCTERQSAGFYSFSKDLGDRSLTTTGVRLDFHTNSKTLKFKTVSGEKLEVLIDGLFRCLYKPQESGIIEECISLTDPVGKETSDVRVTLVFPSHHEPGVLEYVELDDLSYVKPHSFDKKILFIGDSITQGWHTEYDTRSFAFRISNHYNAESVINGVGGAFFHTSVFDKIDFDPDWVFVAYGTNDWGRFPDDNVFITNVREFLDLVKAEYAGKKVFVISPIWRARDNGEIMGERFHMRRREIEREDRERGFIAVDGLKMVPPDPSCYADKYLHPNDLGFGYYYESLVKVIDANI